jgi:hypothetical protein
MSVSHGSSPHRGHTGGQDRHRSVAPDPVQGVGNLLALIEGVPAEACRTIIPTHLVVRHSTAPPPTTA